VSVRCGGQELGLVEEPVRRGHLLHKIAYLDRANEDYARFAPGKLSTI
jgi:hypothetical protein